MIKYKNHIMLGIFSITIFIMFLALVLQENNPDNITNIETCTTVNVTTRETTTVPETTTVEETTKKKVKKKKAIDHKAKHPYMIKMLLFMALTKRGFTVFLTRHLSVPPVKTRNLLHLVLLVFLRDMTGALW